MQNFGRDIAKNLVLLGVALLVSIPFSLSWRVGFQGALYLEVVTWVILLAIIFFGVLAFGLEYRPPEVFWYCLLIAGLAWLQGYLMDLPYRSFSNTITLIGLSLACFSWVINQLVHHLGREKIVTVIAVALLIAIIWQSFVCIVQFVNGTGRVDILINHIIDLLHLPTSWHVRGFIFPTGGHFVFGQLGQRNHLGNYMMWGILATVYLWAKNYLRLPLMLLCLVFLIGTMGLVSSRTVLVYLAVLSILTIIWWAKNGTKVRTMSMMILAVLFAILLAQILVPHLVNWIVNDPNGHFQSGFTRFEANARGVKRWYEWHLAWQVFLKHPLFGVGFMNYTHYGMLENTAKSFSQITNLNELFINCHNLFLQILAETGLVGFIVIIGGLIWLLRLLFRLPESFELFFLMAIIVVVLCHSMLEYPLWYLYFLFSFMLFVILCSPLDQNTKQINPILSWVVIGFMLGGSVALGVALIKNAKDYHYIMRLSATNISDKIRLEKLQVIAQNNPFMAYDVDYAISSLTSDDTIQKNPQLVTLLEKSTTFRPYPSLITKLAVIDAKLGKEQQAQKWIESLFKYFPSRIDYTLDYLQEDKSLHKLWLYAKNLNKSRQKN